MNIFLHIFLSWIIKYINYDKPSENMNEYGK